MVVSITIVVVLLLLCVLARHVYLIRKIPSCYFKEEVRDFGDAGHGTVQTFIKLR